MEKIPTYSSLNRSSSWQSVFNYKLIIVLLIYVYIVYNVLSLFNLSVFYIIYFLILSLIPIMGIYYTIKSEDNAFELLINILRYIFKTKDYRNDFSYNSEEYLMQKIKTIKNINIQEY